MELKSISTEERDDFIVAYEAVMIAFGASIFSKGRPRNVVEARMACSYILRQVGRTFVEIAKYMKKDHTTIIYHINSAKALIETDPNFAKKYVRAREIFVQEKKPLNLLSDRDYKLKNEQLEAEISALKYEKRVLMAEKRELQNKLDMSKKKRMFKIFEFVEKNTPPGFELVTMRKLIKLFDV